MASFNTTNPTWVTEQLYPKQEWHQNRFATHAVRRKPLSANYKPLPYSRPPPEHHFWKKPYSWSTLAFVGDVTVALSPFVFLILAFEALSANNSPSLKHGAAVDEVAKISPTVFPIMFAAIVGRLMRTWATWKAERGARLGTLEQMTGSQNLTSAIERATKISGAGLWGIFIVLLWLLSPLGGQASIRVTNQQPVSTQNETTVYYFNNTGDGINGAFVGTGISSMKETSMNSLLHAALLSVKQNTPRDLWGNVRIPCWNYVNRSNNSCDSEGWCNVVESDSTRYSAMTGIVVSGLQVSLDTNFTMRSAEFNITCSEPHFFPMNSSANGTARYGGFVEWAGPLLVHQNVSQNIFSNTVGNQPEWNSYLFDTNWGTNASKSHPMLNAIYASQGARQTEIGAFNCNVSMIHVESDVLCEGSECQVRRMRLSRSAYQHQDGYPFNRSDPSVLSNMLRWLSSATWMSDWNIVSPIDWYISGSTAPFPRLDMAEYKARDLSYRNISSDIVSIRMASLINTAYQSSYQLSATSQPASDNITALKLGLVPSTAAQGLGYATINTPATTTFTQLRFVASIPWIVTTIVIALILLYCGIATLVFKYTSYNPDILGYVSSMTRENPNFERIRIPDGDRLDGLQRARVLRDLKVQVADDRPWDGNSHLTLKNLGYDEVASMSDMGEKADLKQHILSFTVNLPSPKISLGNIKELERGKRQIQSRGVIY